jgi:hypothetical protein
MHPTFPNYYSLYVFLCVLFNFDFLRYWQDETNAFWYIGRMKSVVQM